MALQTQYNVLIYGLDGTTLLTTIAPDQLKDKIPSFQCRANGGFGECVIDVNWAFDNFGDGTLIKSDAVAEIWAVDAAHPLGRRIYKGYVSKYGSHIEPGFQGVRITLLGLVSLLTHEYYAKSTPVVKTTVDPQAIVEAIIDDFNTQEGGSLITYTHNVSTNLVGTNVSKTFTDIKHFDSIDQTVKMAGSGFWWSVDRDGLLNLKGKPSSPTHLFVIGKHIEKLDAIKDSETVQNDFELRWSAGTATDSDAGSQAAYGHGSGTPTGKRTSIVTDSTITDAPSATQYLATQKANNKDAKVKTSLTVNANYDLESIQVGDTCAILNSNVNNAFFPTNLFIAGFTYNGETMDLVLEDQQQDMTTELRKLLKI